MKNISLDDEFSALLSPDEGHSELIYLNVAEKSYTLLQFFRA